MGEISAFNLRQFDNSDTDYNALVMIEQHTWPGEPITKEGLQHDDSTWDSSFSMERWIIESENQPVGYLQWSETPWAYESGKYFIKIMVLPQFQGRGFGTQAYHYILNRLPQPRLLTATIREDQPAAVRFVEKRGFQRVIRELESRLDVSKFDRTAFEPTLNEVAQSGIVIHSVREMQTRNPDWLKKWWTLRWTIIPDMPTSEAFSQETLEEFEVYLTSPQIDLNAAFVALDTTTGEWVGMSSLSLYPEDPEILYVGNTGVVRSHRRRGIALALKVHTIDFAKAYGAKVIIGENEESNPMYLLNQKLGFQHSLAWLGYEKRL
jgi:GNAT superfamily N-acetyltransferase